MRSRPRIIAVDDDDLILESLKSELGKHFDLVTAPRASKALAIMEKEPFDCVISDVRMPGMDGVTFLKEVGTRHPFVGRILITAFSDTEATKAAMFDRGVFKVSKPWRDELEIAIRRALELRSLSMKLDSNLQRFYRSVELERQFRQQTNPLILIEQALAVIAKLNHVISAELKIQLGTETRTIAVTTPEGVRFLEKNTAQEKIILRHEEGKFRRKDTNWSYTIGLWDEGKKHYFLECSISSLRQEELSWIDFVVEQFADAMERSALVKEVEHQKQLADQSHGQLSNMEKMASLGLLSAGVAHEINNPAAYVRANLSVMEDYLEDFSRAIKKADALLDGTGNRELVQAWENIKKEEQLDQTRDEIVEMLVETREGVERIIDIAVNLKTFARHGVVERKRVSLHQCLETSLTMMMYRYKHGINIERQYSAQPEVLGTTAEFSQVFLNLLLNAAQAMSGKGTITVGLEKDGQWVRVFIADTGPGIDKSLQEKIFEPLFTTKEYGEGTGLGLSISKEIIERCGGRMEVQSSIGNGAKFIMMLPSIDESNDENW